MSHKARPEQYCHVGSVCGILAADMDIRQILQRAVDGEIPFDDLVSMLRATLRSRPLAFDDLDYTISELTAMRRGVDRVLKHGQAVTLRKVRNDLTKLIDAFKAIRANAIARSIPDAIGRDFE